MTQVIQIRRGIAVGNDGQIGVALAQPGQTAQFFLTAPILSLQMAVEPIPGPVEFGA
jgi:hypothetical protein